MSTVLRIRLVVLMFIAFGCIAYAQQEEIQDASTIDSLYREDQLYFGLNFNLLSDRPDEVSQSGFSGSFQGGFIRDMPLNKRRNKAIGVGLGLAADVFNQNLFIGEETDGETTIYNVIGNNVNSTKNRFAFYSIEMPIQYRWRTSKPSEYTFWRIHAGVQLGYIYAFKSTFEQTNNSVVQTDVPELNRFQYGLTFAFGYSAFNLNMYYGLNTLFNENAKLEGGENVDLKVLRIGIQFYFL